MFRFDIGFYLSFKPGSIWVSGFYHFLFTHNLSNGSLASERQRFNSKGGFSGKQSQGFSKGKGKFSKGKSKGKTMDSRLKGLNLAWRTPDGRELCFQWNNGECDGSCGRVHQCRVKGCYGTHKAVDHSKSQGTS